MPLWIQIAPGSKQPVYKQIYDQISQMIAQGKLNTGDKLPAVRNLAAELVVNPNTVARAYSLLEQRGLVITKTGAGTFVSDPKLQDPDMQQLSILNDRLDNLISQAVNIGLTNKQIKELFENRLGQFQKNKDADSEGGSTND